MTKRAAIYCRVSTEKQAAQGLSLEKQEADCRAFVARQGWALTEDHVYVERGVSGAKKSRPALDRLVDAIQTDELDVLISPWIDRLGRSLKHGIELYETLDGHGVQLWKPDGQRFDGDSPEGRMMRNQLAAFAQYERDMISARVAAITPVKVARGSYHGGPVPFGYEKGEAGGLVVREDRAAVVRRCFEEYATGTSAYAIARALRQEGVSTALGGKWTPQRVLEILRSPIYTGMVGTSTHRRDFDRAVPGKHDAIVSDDLWRRVAARLSAQSNLNGSGRGREPTVHLLSHGLLRCECGGVLRVVTLRSSSRSGRTEDRPIYECGVLQGVTKRERGCTMPNLPQRLVDEAVIAFLRSEVMSAGLTEREQVASRDAAEKEARRAVTDAERAVKQAEDRLVAAEVRWLDGDLADDRYRTLCARFGSERDAATLALRSAQATLGLLEDPDPSASDALALLRDEATEDGKHVSAYRDLIRKVFDSFEVVVADADAPEVIDGVPMPTFLYRPSRRGRARAYDDGKLHRYYLLPNVRPELAEVWNGIPLMPAPEGITLRDGEGWQPSKEVSALVGPDGMPDEAAFRDRSSGLALADVEEGDREVLGRGGRAGRPLPADREERTGERDHRDPLGQGRPPPRRGGGPPSRVDARPDPPCPAPPPAPGRDPEHRRNGVGGEHRERRAQGQLHLRARHGRELLCHPHEGSREDSVDASDRDRRSRDGSDRQGGLDHPEPHDRRDERKRDEVRRKPRDGDGFEVVAGDGCGGDGGGEGHRRALRERGGESAQAAAGRRGEHEDAGDGGERELPAGLGGDARLDGERDRGGHEQRVPARAHAADREGGESRDRHGGGALQRRAGAGDEHVERDEECQAPDPRADARAGGGEQRQGEGAEQDDVLAADGEEVAEPGAAEVVDHERVDGLVLAEHHPAQHGGLLGGGPGGEAALGAPPDRVDPAGEAAAAGNG